MTVLSFVEGDSFGNPMSLKPASNLVSDSNIFKTDKAPLSSSADGVFLNCFVFIAGNV